MFFIVFPLAFFRKGPTFAPVKMKRTKMKGFKKEDNNNENNEA